MRTKLSSPTHSGSVNRLYFVKARYSEKIIGPTVRPRNPISHGTRNPYPATVSRRLAFPFPPVVGPLRFSSRLSWRVACRTLLDPASAVTIDSVSVLTLVLRFLEKRYSGPGGVVLHRAREDRSGCYWLRTTSISLKNCSTASSTVTVPKPSSCPSWRNFSSTVPQPPTGP